MIVPDRSEKPQSCRLLNELPLGSDNRTLSAPQADEILCLPAAWSPPVRLPTSSVPGRRGRWAVARVPGGWLGGGGERSSRLRLAALAEQSVLRDPLTDGERLRRVAGGQLPEDITGDRFRLGILTDLGEIFGQR